MGILQWSFYGNFRRLNMRKLFNRTLILLALALGVYSYSIISDIPHQDHQAYAYTIDADTGEVVEVTTTTAVPTPAPAADWPSNCYKPDAQDRRIAACQALQNAGFNRDGIQIMLAIAQGESGIRLDAAGDQHLANSKWGASRGAWQIRSLNSERGKGSCRDENALINNGWDFHAKCAYEISGQGRNYKPWSVFLKNIYKQYL